MWDGEKNLGDFAGAVHIRLYVAARPVMVAEEGWAVHGALAKVFAVDDLILCQSSPVDEMKRTVESPRRTRRAQ